eukprot:1582406-Prymnesium_polylepis.1
MALCATVYVLGAPVHALAAPGALMTSPAAAAGILPDSRKARCPIRTGRHVSPGRWVCVCACIMLVCESGPVP